MYTMGMAVPAASRAFQGLLWLLVIPALLCSDALRAAPNETAVSAALGMEQDAAPVLVDGKELFRVRGTSLLPATRRAARIAERIAQFAADDRLAPDSVQVKEEGEITRIVAGETALIVLADFDAEGMPRRRLAELLAADIVRAVEWHRASRAPRVLLANTGYAIGFTLLAGSLAWGMVRARAWAFGRLRRRYGVGGTDLKIQSVQLLKGRQLWMIARAAINMLTTGLLLVIAYLHLSTVLGLYPWTRPLADRLFQLFLEPLQSMGAAVLASVPNLTFILVLVLVTRFALKALRLMFAGIETGAIHFEGFDPEWSQPTYKIARILVVAFALVVAYPYIPGSDSQAFKGVSLFLGVIFSLGSSSVIANVIAGYTMTYRKAFRVGDRVAIGEVAGFVTETSVLVTRIRTVKNEEVVLPNSEILGTAVTNYSTLARNDGVILHTTVGIGYETPWRQVEAMLLMAAARTAGLERDPPPFVLQKSLGDFCVVYEINATSRDVARMGSLYSALHANILDVFNEYGVQIMTPAYEGDTEMPKVVPREQWYLEPAAPPAPASTAR